MIEIKVNVTGNGSDMREFATDKLDVRGQTLYFKNSKGDATGMYVVPEGAYVVFTETT
jgi:hypothetical protein